MARLVLLGAATAVCLAASVLHSRSDSVPQLDVEPSCRAAQRAALVVGRDGESCRTDERTARGNLADQWNSFSAADKNHCTSLVHAGGPPSYVELLSCLEVSRDARRIVRERAEHSVPASETTGAGTAETPSR